MPSPNVWALKVALSLALLAALVPPDAHASYAADNPITLAVKRASIFWHQYPCGGHVEVRSELPTPEFEAALGGIEPEGWSTWNSPSGRNSKESPATSFTECAIVLNRRAWPDWTTDDQAFWSLCTMFLHEFGNLLGIPELHTSGSSVMDWELVGEVPTICVPYRLRMPNGRIALAFH